jgi:polysaccharide biosynthesis protein
VISLQSFKKITEIESFIDKLTQLFDNPATEKKDITQLMKTFLVNFNHQETGKYLDSKM